MPVIPIPITIKSQAQLQKAVKYILNPDKTQEQVLTSGHLINNLSRADFEMLLTRKLAIQTHGKQSTKNEIFARHLIQSFDPKDHFTPKEVHELGRQFVFETFGKEYEFVIATHVDKGHLHNHIIINATSSKDLKKMHYQRNMLQTMRQISDRIVDLHHGLTLPEARRNSYSRYQKWRRQNLERLELKNRLEFCLRYAFDYEDFCQKTKLLGVQVDDQHRSSKKEIGDFISYSLEGFSKRVRDFSMSKQRKYSKENIIDRLKDNELTLTDDAFLATYYENEKLTNLVPEIVVTLKAEQVREVTDTALYIPLKLGRQKGEVRVYLKSVEPLKDGSYELHLGQKEFFYFFDETHHQDGRSVTATTLARQLSQDNHLPVLTRHQAMKALQSMVLLLNVLSQNHVQGKTAFHALNEDFQKNIEATQTALEELDSKIVAFNEQLKFHSNQATLKLSLKNLEQQRQELHDTFEQVAEVLQSFEYYEAQTEYPKGKPSTEDKLTLE